MRYKHHFRRALAVATLLAMLLPSVPAVASGEDLTEYISDGELTDRGTDDVAAIGATPTEEQYAYQRQELAAFLHFNMNTFTGNEWGDGTESPDQFTLDKKVDADHYVKTLKEAGFGSLIVTGKHHDGFCIWDSAWTEHDTANTNYPGGDVLADISAACTKYDMKMGLYLSPWDENSEYYGYYDEDGNPTTEENDVLKYDDFYVGQLEEILGNDKYGNNGEFYEIWMDGAKGTGADAQYYDTDRYVSVIKRYEGEDVLLFGASRHTNVFWIGNEAGVAGEETWAQANVAYDGAGNITSINCTPYVTNYKGVETYPGFKNGGLWCIPEVDARITSGWFWGENKRVPKTLTQLRDMYMDSVGHNSVLLLNVPLNDQGELDDAIEDRLREWGENLQKSFFENNLAAAEGATVLADSVHNLDIRFAPSNVADGNDDTYWTAEQGRKVSSLLVDFGREVVFDALTIEEEIRLGQRVEAFTVYYKTADGEWREYDRGTTIGSKRVLLGKPVQATQVRVEFTGLTKGDGTVATPVISHLGVYKTTEAFAYAKSLPDGVTEIPVNDPRIEADGWQVKTPESLVEDTYYSGRAGDVMTVTFTGSKAWLRGIPVKTTLSVSVDGGEAVSVTPSDTMFFETGDLAYGEHTLTVQVDSGNARITGVDILDNGGVGLLDFEHSLYSVDEDRWLEVKVLRKGGAAGTLSAIVQDNPGSAVQSSYVPTEGIPVVFSEGETEKTVRIRIKRYAEKTGTLSFTLDLVPGEGTAELAKGFNTPARVEILDAEGLNGPYLQGIRIDRVPDRTEYGLGESPDHTGLVVTGEFTSGILEWNEIVTGKKLGEAQTVQLDQPVTARNLRLLLESAARTSEEIPRVAEIEVYNGESEVNLALSATAAACSEFNELRASLVNDGDPASRWSAQNVNAEAMPVWVQLQWSETVTFDRVVIREWKVDTAYRADEWSLHVADNPVFTRELEADEYVISTEGDMTAEGQVTYTVTATENPAATAGFTVSVVDRQAEADRSAAAAVEKLILALPDADRVTPAHETAIAEARQAYDSLTEVQKAYVTDGAVKKLTDGEARLQELKKQTQADGELTNPAETTGQGETDGASSDGGMTSGLVALICVGCVVLIGGGAATAVFVIRKKRTP